MPEERGDRKREWIFSGVGSIFGQWSHYKMTEANGTPHGWASPPGFPVLFGCDARYDLMKRMEYRRCALSQSMATPKALNKFECARSGTQFTEPKPPETQGRLEDNVKSMYLISG